MSSENPRRQQMPVLFVRGTHHEVGIAIGRTFKNFMNDVINQYHFLDDLLIPNYNTARGADIYKSALDLCKNKFPGYVEELEGIAVGSEIPFYKLFLLNIEVQIVPSNEDEFFESKLETGCTCILSYPDKDTVLLGHTEDARKVLRNNVFILDAEILNHNGEKLEKFTTLCYSCALPGFTMGYNEHGLFHSMNSLVPSKISNKKTPIAFLMRALLGATSLNSAIEILKDTGTGTADGFSVNFIFAPFGSEIPILQNVEVAPNCEALESRLDIKTVGCGETYVHCNKYIRMDVQQQMDKVVGSEKRWEAIAKYPKPFKIDTVKESLSDQGHPTYPVFRGWNSEVGEVDTVAVGIFDLAQQEWSIYTTPPAASAPVVVLPIRLAKRKYLHD